MISRIYTALLGSILMIVSVVNVSASEGSIIGNIIKIKTYNHLYDGSFVFSSYGSAIAIDSSRILTNAHVITNDNGEPTGNYEVCFSDTFEEVPHCRDVAKLIAYDTVADLAILELVQTKNLIPFSFSKQKIAIGSYVSMYGYPQIGGETITRTDGKIAGFEQSMYKIDGSIDHGNSGGWAFNNSGELVGIPTAVASDNASIGYMIPIKRIQEFLSKKTTNYDIYTRYMDQNFVKFIKRNQSYSVKNLSYKWNNVIAKNPRPYGFRMKNTMISADNTMIHWTFIDDYERVKFVFSCTNDAGWILGWQVRKNGFENEKKQYPNWNMSILDEDKYMTIYSSSKWYKSSVVMYYKDYDACFVDLEYLDSKKDAKSLARAMQYIKKWISFSGKYVLKNAQENQFFSIKNAQENTRVIKSIDALGTESVLLGFEIPKWNWMNAVIEWKKYDTQDDLWIALSADFGDIKTWNDYIALGIKNGIDPSRIHLINLGVNQKGLLYSVYNTEKKSTNIIFEYTFVTWDNQYGYINWSVTMNGNFTPDVEQFQNLFSQLILPGRSFLQ